MLIFILIALFTLNMILVVDDWNYLRHIVWGPIGLMLMYWGYNNDVPFISIMGWITVSCYGTYCIVQVICMGEYEKEAPKKTDTKTDTKTDNDDQVCDYCGTKIVAFKCGCCGHST